MKNPSELMNLLVEATTADEIIAALAPMTYGKAKCNNAHYSSRIPSGSELVEWWDRDGATDLLVEVEECLCRVLGMLNGSGGHKPRTETLA